MFHLCEQHVACGAELGQSGLHRLMPACGLKLAKLAHERMHPLGLTFDFLKGRVVAIALVPLATQPRARTAVRQLGPWWCVVLAGEVGVHARQPGPLLGAGVEQRLRASARLR